MGHIYYCEHCDYDAKGRPSNYYRHLRTLKHQKAVKRTKKLTETHSISDDSIDESLDKNDMEQPIEKDDIDQVIIPTKKSCFSPLLDIWLNYKPKGFIVY
jgi:hypothetical protein